MPLKITRPEPGITCSDLQIPKRANSISGANFSIFHIILYPLPYIYSSNDLGAAGATSVSSALSALKSLTSLIMRWNLYTYVGDRGLP